MGQVISNKKYFIDQLNSSKANQFVAMYHYSHRGFRGAKVNLGIFDKETNKLVGVLQWGRAAVHNIRLDRYVKEPIALGEYLELNRFAMADSEEKNSESQAISLGIKWIKKNLPKVRLLVSYAGRIEGNYGYIYQATNWEYLGYFISKSFWILDGEEYHATTVGLKYKKYGGNYDSMMEFLCDTYHNVVQYDSKQFIYIMRLDKRLTPASPILDYPKPANEYPVETYRINHQIDNSFTPEPAQVEIKDFYYNPDEPLFTASYYERHQNDDDSDLYNIIQYKRKLHALRMRREKFQYVVYDRKGKLIDLCDSIAEILRKFTECRETQLREHIMSGTAYKGYYIKKIPYGSEYEQTIKVDSPLCWIDDKAFYRQVDIAKYTGVTRQAVSCCYKHKGKIIGGKEVIWYNEE